LRVVRAVFVLLDAVFGSRRPARRGAVFASLDSFAFCAMLAPITPFSVTAWLASLDFGDAESRLSGSVQ
jgi:hypothetical protein